jgi:Tol biopolymer transport system component
VQPDAPATLLAKDGSQPAVDPAGRLLLFHGTRAENYGINAINARVAESEATTALRYTAQAEDAKDSPPTWASDGMRLAFASRREGDRSSRIYLKTTNNDGAPTILLPGEDPAWRPSGDGESWLAFVGRDEGGNNPGLWLVTDDGADRRPLTAYDGDRRPAWSRDTQQIVFMRKEAGDNWEVYRLLIGPDKRPEKGSDALSRLTNNPAQDGLPTLSPDGKYVAFVSDRDGIWQIWVRPVEGDDDALPIAPVQGVLVNWLEHALQWTE